MKNIHALGLLCALAFSTSVFAESGGGSSNSSGDRGDSTRERGDASDRGSRGELNYDNQMQNADRQIKHGTQLKDIRQGTPNSPEINEELDELRNHR